MNRKLLLAILLIGVVSAIESYGQVTYIGGAGHYGTAIKELGIGANAIYTINEQIDFAPGFVYFFPHKEDPKDERDVGYVQNTWWSVNLDGHYIPIETDLFQAYGLMGLNFTSIEVKKDYLIQGSVNDRLKERKTTSELGLNIGGGVHLKLGDKVTPFAEAKYTLGEADQLVFSFGILFRISEDKVRENTEDF